MNTLELSVIENAINILSASLKSTKNPEFTSSTFTRKYLSLEMSNEWREVFSVMFLNTQHQLIYFKKLFFGTLNSAEVHPRVIAKEALLVDATAIILCHNHPSGNINPSHADISLTKRLIESLSLFDIKVLDHIIVSQSETYSLSEAGHI